MQILEFERINEKQFTKLLIPPVNKLTLRATWSVCSSLCHAWAMQVEVLAIATFLKVPVYNSTKLMLIFTGKSSNPLKKQSRQKSCFVM